MWSTAREIAEGDTVILWFRRDSCKAITIRSHLSENGQYGHYKHADLIGVPYGSKVGSKNGKGFIYVLRPTPELWTLALPHRTQILYAADIAFVVAWLGVRVGSVVVEAGTGSGSFSHSVARTIGPTGQLHTFEFHEARFKSASAEFLAHNLSPTPITLRHRNVCKDGFEPVRGIADAVFLDLPAPWSAIPHILPTLSPTHTTRICCFSPCIEQVLRTVSSLNEHGFTSITTYETLLRTMDVGTHPVLKKIGEVSAGLKQQAVRKEERRVRQINESKSKMGKHAREENFGADGEDGEEEDLDGEELPAKKIRDQYGNGKAVVRTKVDVEKVSLAKPFAEQRGHTSYLTFAVMLPKIYPGSESTEQPQQEDTVMS